MIAIGVGCRRNCHATEIVALVRECLLHLPDRSANPRALFTLAEKRDEQGLAAAAATLDLPLHFVEGAALRRAAPAARTRSPRVENMFGVPSVAETAALAGAGPGAILLVARRTSAAATCAIAESAGAGP